MSMNKNSVNWLKLKMSMIRNSESHIHSNQLESLKTKILSYLAIEMRLHRQEPKDFMRNGKIENRKYNLKEMNFLRRNKNFAN